MPKKGPRSWRYSSPPGRDAGQLRNQRVDLRQATIIGAAGILFAQVGASLALAMSGRLLTQVFGVFVSLVGLRMVAAVYKASRGAGAGGRE